MYGHTRFPSNPGVHASRFSRHCSPDAGQPPFAAQEPYPGFPMDDTAFGAWARQEKAFAADADFAANQGGFRERDAPRRRRRHRLSGQHLMYLALREVAWAKGLMDRMPLLARHLRQGVHGRVEWGLAQLLEALERFGAAPQGDRAGGPAFKPAPEPTLTELDDDGNEIPEDSGDADRLAQDLHKQRISQEQVHREQVHRQQVEQEQARQQQLLTELIRQQDEQQRQLRQQQLREDLIRQQDEQQRQLRQQQLLEERIRQQDEQQRLARQSD
ncbi:hypothetical protein GT347_00965 [Xylophilus rhododendri]|uniref:Uncharacterized protein n=1 Tax=Xylophilus rhododendri TaxID=2697032 RepID=A0A857J1C8_9BURK|nr:hypothetical protein [Xylophilus rhododendri]QHI96685.1 hypothetical protein GT347_00965 [Xylophilus rhododendri]